MSTVLYRSTRSGGGEEVPFRDALLTGLAPDGGLYLPDSVPPLPAGWRETGSFVRLATQVLDRWVGEPAGERLAVLLAEALDFPVPLAEIGRDRFVLELFHGPTLSFKDFGARVMAPLMDHYLAESGESLTILVATSGDTGSAVADGFAGLENVRVVLLYPKGKVSEVQERQLTASRPGLRTLRVLGDFDDCQRLVKEAFADVRLEGRRLSSANSINIGRLLPQQLYYVWAVSRLWNLRRDEVPPLVVVPSGNLGNLTAGVLAARSGLPVARFVAAHNANDYFPSFISGGVEPYAFRPTVPTISNAMDVGAPSNFERLYSLLGERLPLVVWGSSVDDDSTRERMRAEFVESRYIACPHTAVGLEGVERYRQATGDLRPALVLATAHPAKFPSTVEEVLGEPPPRSERLERLLALPNRAEEIEPRLEALREVLLEDG